MPPTSSTQPPTTWQTPAERFEGTLFTDRGFDHVPALAGVADLLSELLATAA